MLERSLIALCRCLVSHKLLLVMNKLFKSISGGQAHPLSIWLTGCAEVRGLPWLCTSRYIVAWKEDHFLCTVFMLATALKRNRFTDSELLVRL